jgi:hypothetical protein
VSFSMHMRNRFVEHSLVVVTELWGPNYEFIIYLTPPVSPCLFKTATSCPREVTTLSTDSSTPSLRTFKPVRSF